MFEILSAVFGVGMVVSAISFFIFAAEPNRRAFNAFLVCAGITYLCGVNTFYSEVTSFQLESPQNVRIRTTYSTEGRWFKDEEKVSNRKLELVKTEVE